MLFCSFERILTGVLCGHVGCMWVQVVLKGGGEGGGGGGGGGGMVGESRPAC